jgi:hypothetical protein
MSDDAAMWSFTSDSDTVVIKMQQLSHLLVEDRHPH